MIDWKYVPEMGDGATTSVGSDRYPYTIVEVSRQTVDREVKNPANPTETAILKWPKWIEVTKDTWKVITGSMRDGSAEYDYTSNFFNTPEKFIYKDGSYYAATKIYDPETKTYRTTNTCRKDSQRLSVGVRQYYYDPSF